MSCTGCGPITRLNLSPRPVRALLVLFLLPILGSASTLAQTTARGTGSVHFDDQVRYYDINGRTERDLLQGMMTRAPMSEGTRFFGLTSTEVRYTYRRAETSIGCDLSDVQVYLRVVTTLPRWQPYSGIPYELERRWRSFDRSLQIHENGHKQLALEEADMIRRALDSVRTPSCSTMDNEARNVATRIRDTYLRRHDAYDARTDHGSTQGAIWPLRTAN